MGQSLGEGLRNKVWYHVRSDMAAGDFKAAIDEILQQEDLAHRLSGGVTAKRSMEKIETAMLAAFTTHEDAEFSLFEAIDDHSRLLRTKTDMVSLPVIIDAAKKEGITAEAYVQRLEKLAKSNRKEAAGQVYSTNGDLPSSLRRVHTKPV